MVSFQFSYPNRLIIVAGILLPDSFPEHFRFFSWIGQAAQRSVYFGGFCGEEVANGTSFFYTMKHARINTVHKSGSIILAENYKPTSILPIFCNFFEKLINKQIMNYLETDKLLEQNQYGFRSSLGTADILTKFTNITLTVVVIIVVV